MFGSKSSSFAILLAAFAPVALGRELIIERDGRAFYPRRFGQENVPISQISCVHLSLSRLITC